MYLKIQLERIETKLIGLFRQYCYCVAGGRSGENADPNLVSSEQFREFARDCGTPSGLHAMNRNDLDLDQLFLRAMFNDRSAKPAPGAADGPPVEAAAEGAYTTMRLPLIGQFKINIRRFHHILDDSAIFLARFELKNGRIFDFFADRDRFYDI